MLAQEREKLQAIKTFPSLVKYLREELDWPIETDNFDEIVFDYEAEELGIDPETAVKIDEIKQLRPLVTNQPWGIFFIKFEPKRLPVVVLRRILSRLVFKKRASASKSEHASWNLDDLLFISNYGEDEQRQITFAHFSQDKERSDLPTLKVLGWDDADTALHLDYCHQELKGKLHWPDDERNLKDWCEKWSSAFTLRHREVIVTSKDLAMHLADLARRIRRRANRVLAFETEHGHLRKLYKSFQEALIHDLSEDDFADMYAQTIAYGLLASRVSRPMGVTVSNVTDMIPITNPFLKDMLSTFLTAGGRKEAIDFDELGVQEVVELLNSPDTHMDAILRDFGNRTQQEDPVIYFYELFLSEYDKKKKVQRGIFYTPQPVVSYIVRSVHELLQNEFELEDGLADITTWGEMAKRKPDIKIPEGILPDEPFVQILDPAAGTATFLVEVIDIIHKTMRAKWIKQGCMALETQGLWNEYVSKHLLPRLYGFELMMAPYAIAHMKLGMKLYETGYAFNTNERVHVYLTNSLEPATDSIPHRVFEQWAPALAHEALAVNDIKGNKRFTVVIGNPPYSIFSANLTPSAKLLVEQYRHIEGIRVKEKGALKAEVILQDDYVKFLALAQNTVVSASVGLLGFITNSNCYYNPVLRGLRYSLLTTFPLIFCLDLGGQTKAGIEDDANVFDIETGVAISVLVRLSKGLQLRRFRTMTGSRLFKYTQLSKTTCTAECTQDFNPQPEQYLFKAFSSGFTTEYQEFFPVDKMFGVTSIGIKTARDHLVLDFERTALEERMQCLLDPTNKTVELRERFRILDNTQWCFDDARKEFKKTFSEDYFNPVVARPFDIRWIYFHPSMVFNTRPTVNKHVHRKRNLCLLTMRRIRTTTYDHFFVTNRIAMGEILSSADNCNFFPLYLYHEDALSRQMAPSTNLTHEFLSYLADKLKIDLNNDFPQSITPEDIFQYTYCVFHSKGYRSRYDEFLKVDFPRLPLTSNLELFRALCCLGAELVSLHLMESPQLNVFFTRWQGSRPSSEVEKVTYSDKTVWIDKVQTQGFRGVPENVWNFHIGGYQVCHKWLDDRRKAKRRLSADDITHYQKIVVALNETIRLMKEIDEVIEEHGGWPGAFEQDR